MYITLTILLLSVLFFVNGKVRSDIVALCALAALLIFQILTPEEALAIPLTVSKKKVNAAAFANLVRGQYAVHLVNNGADCFASITGLPKEVKSLKVYVTNTQDSMKETTVQVQDGVAKVWMPAISFVTVLSE